MKKVVRYTWILFLTLRCAGSLFAQTSPTFEAKVIDPDNNPVPFASVRLIGFGSGVITNADGSFQIPAMESFLTDTLAITCIGFKPLRVPMKQLKTGIINFVKLKPLSVELPTVEIRTSKSGRLTGKKIVAAAINQLKYNCPQGAFAYIAYYRDYQIENGGYVNMNEAIVKVNDQGFLTNDQLKTKLELIEYKANTNFPIDPYARQPYDNREQKFIPHAYLDNFAGNELATLMVHDPIRNHDVQSFSFINKLDKNFIANHSFSLAGQISEEGRTLYMVRFVAHEYVTGYGHNSSGKIYIEKTNYRIHKLEYATWENYGSQTKPMYQVTVEYALRGSAMFLNYISFNNKFSMRSPDDFRVIEILQLKDTAAFVVKFSHQPTKESVESLTNYELRLDGNRIQLDSVRFIQNRYNEPEYHRSAILYVTDKVNFNKLVHRSLKRAISIDVHGVKDLVGREVNARTFVEATQYREIFVQQVVNPGDSSKYTDIDRFKPLFLLLPSVGTSTSRFWMNTPLKKELLSERNRE